MKSVGGLVFSALVAFAGCASPVASAPAGAPIQAIMRLEDMRTIGPNGELLQYLSDPDAAVRSRAATAVGRLKFPCGGESTTAKLRALLRDKDEGVRAATAFALGVREDPSAYDDLVGLGSGATKDASALVRARALEAASKLNRHELDEQFLTGLGDPSEDVRLEAAAGTARWKSDAPNASDVNGRVAAFVAKETDLRARTYGLFALERRKAKEGRDVCLKSAQASDVDERLFSVRGLANLAGDLAVDAALIQASRDGDWRIAVEALRGLARSSTLSVAETIASATQSESHHVRATAIESAMSQLGEFRKADLVEKTPGVGKFDPLDPSTAVRAASGMNLLRLEGYSGLALNDSTKHERAALQRFRGGESWPSSWPVFMTADELEHEHDPFVLGAYIEQLGKLKYEGTQRLLRAYVHDSDNGLRLAAVTALLAQDKPQIDISQLVICYDTAKGEVSSELRFNILKLAAKIGGDDAKKLLEHGLDDSDAFVRRTAHDELEKLTGTRIPWVDKPLPEVELAFPGEGMLANLHPHVVIATDRGEMEFVLFADEAPQHVYNFLEHADFYKGTTFHRVVSDFVAQGGDARGDGNGGSSWRGDALRHEITPRKYVRGSLGMPRNEDWDSGGSQIFITHRPTPHLDGRYTIFGELVKGFDVLDALDLGDKILEVRVLR